MPLLESGEMYLETIFILSKTKKNFRSIDIVEHMGYSKPSVSRAVGLLKNGGYILVDNDGFISLTEDGLEIATKIYERHTLLTSFLASLGIDKDIASADACKIEHYLSEETLNAIKKYMKK